MPFAPGTRLSRIGGDEFVVLTPLSSKPDFTKVEDRIATVIKDVREITGYEEAGASVGIAALSDVEFKLQEALRTADKRMYENKKSRLRAN